MVLGCTDPFACNYDPIANTDNGSCVYHTFSYDTLISNISISWNGLILSSSGNYSVSLYNAVGCDSIANLSFILDPTSSINNNIEIQRSLTKITDVLGRRSNGKRDPFLFYIYDDGTVEKKIIIE